MGRLAQEGGSAGRSAGSRPTRPSAAGGRSGRRSSRSLACLEWDALVAGVGRCWDPKRHPALCTHSPFVRSRPLGRDLAVSWPVTVDADVGALAEPCGRPLADGAGRRGAPSSPRCLWLCPVAPACVSAHTPAGSTPATATQVSQQREQVQAEEGRLQKLPKRLPETNTGGGAQSEGRPCGRRALGGGCRGRIGDPPDGAIGERRVREAPAGDGRVSQAGAAVLTHLLTPPVRQRPSGSAGNPPELVLGLGAGSERPSALKARR